MTHQPGYRDGEFIGRCDDIPVLTESRFHVVEDFMPEAWAVEMLSWGQNNFVELLEQSGEQKSYQASSSIDNLAKRCPEVNLLLDAIVAQTLTAAEACRVDVPDEPVFVEAWLSHRQEGEHFHWHTDRDPIAEQTRILSFCYYLHSVPCQFMGGELEFFDGVQIPPNHNLLVMFHPFMIHRVRHVHAVPRGWGGSNDEGVAPATWPDVEPVHWLDARWNVTGWIHSEKLENQL